MYLKSIKTNGFKSFADKTNIVLDNNITCIVGPNGSGKSNIVDAIRWVLGEQSVKSLRGTNSMADIIFAGSKTRDKSTRSEVALTFDNTDKYLNSDATEIEVKRILYRSGESEYFINNVKVRLKDITDLFLDTGAGNESFNIISQGSIESIVNSKPFERRTIFESAAGVLKYKKRKEESLKKLEKTKENIEKVNLIIEELKVNLEPLKEQSKNAKIYLNLKDELKNIEISSITSEITSINDTYTKLKIEIEELNTLLLNEDAASSDDASNLEKLKLKNIRLEEKISEANQKLLEATSKFINLQNEKVMYTERKNIEGNTSDLEKNVIRLKEEIAEFDNTINILANEIKNLEENLKKQTRDLEDINESSSMLKIKRNNLQSKYQETIQEIYSLTSKKEILENNILNDTKIPSSVKNILNNVRLKGVYNTIGKLIEIPNEFASAIDVALSSSANFLIVKDERVAKECINFLKENKLGRATFFPLNIIKERTIPDNIINEISKEKGFVGIASDLVTYEEKFTNCIKNQLGNVIVVNNIDTLNEIGKIIEYKYRIVSLDGDIMHAGGSLTGGTLKNDYSAIKDKMELENIKNKINTMTEENNKRKTELEKFENELIKLNKKEEELNRSIINLKESINDKTNILESKKQKELELNKELDGTNALKDGNIDKKLIALIEEFNVAENNKNILENDLQTLKDEKNNLLSEIAELEKIYKEKNSNYNRLQNELKTKEVSIGKLDIKLDNLLLTLNENYNLTYENAKVTYPLEMDINIAKDKVASLKKEIASLGEVNVYAIEEYDRVSTRYEFLTHQLEDLEQASVNLMDIISEMDTIMVERFTKTFKLISDEFKIVFKKLFKGGNGNLTLTDPDNILETGIEIIAEPPGKKLNSIGLLSGGEKTLTAISLLFAILNVKTVPFCVLDEIEAALDEANVDAFGKYLQEYKKNSQFILITHKKRTMEYADTLYGITMQESGVSKIVSVKLENV